MASHGHGVRPAGLGKVVQTHASHCAFALTPPLGGCARSQPCFFKEKGRNAERAAWALHQCFWLQCGGVPKKSLTKLSAGTSLTSRGPKATSDKPRAITTVGKIQRSKRR